MKLKFLDGLRGIAALYVMIGHARFLLWEGYQHGYLLHSNQYSTVNKMFMYFFSLFKYGHQFVLLFFVLSGLVIHLGFANKLAKDSECVFDFRKYIYKRAKRIYPPFLFAILLTLLLDTLGKYYGFTIYSGNTPNSLINTNVGTSNHQLTTLIGNIFFLYTNYVPLFGTNGPSWSLKLEWWFYLCYPFFLILSRTNIYRSSLLILILFIAGAFPFLWPVSLLKDIFSSMLSWWLGVLIAEVIAGRLKVSLKYFSIFSFLLYFLFAFVFKLEYCADLQIALLFSAIISLLLWFNSTGKRFYFLEKLKPFGDFSYTLYIIHFPIFVFASGLIMKYNNNTLPMNSYFIIIGIIVAIVISYIVHFLVEVPFTKSNPKKLEQK